MGNYNYKNCQSLFGYAANVHIRYKCKCQLCGCGDENDIDLWRQMTVEHLIGKSQGGYLKQIRAAIENKFSNSSYSDEDKDHIITKIDVLNTVTACSFCNSTTSRNKSSKTMYELIDDIQYDRDIDKVLSPIKHALLAILKDKKNSVKWKIESVNAAFKKEIREKVISS